LIKNQPGKKKITKKQTGDGGGRIGPYKEKKLEATEGKKELKKNTGGKGYTRPGNREDGTCKKRRPLAKKKKEHKARREKKSLRLLSPKNRCVV